MSSSREGALLRGAAAVAAVARATGAPALRSTDGAGGFRLGDVYAAELARLRQQAHAEGFAAGRA
jgi:flagellar assembly protein FliH